MSNKQKGIKRAAAEDGDLKHEERPSNKPKTDPKNNKADETLKVKAELGKQKWCTYRVAVPLSHLDKLPDDGKTLLIRVQIGNRGGEITIHVTALHSFPRADGYRWIVVCATISTFTAGCLHRYLSFEPIHEQFLHVHESKSEADTSVVAPATSTTLYLSVLVEEPVD
jgi:hypothetical protein